MHSEGGQDGSFLHFYSGKLHRPAMAVLMAPSISMRLPSVFHQHGSSKRRSSSVSHVSSPPTHTPPPQQPSSRKAFVRTRALSLHSLKSALVDANRSAPAETATVPMSSSNVPKSANLAPPQPKSSRPGHTRSESATSVKSAVEHFTESVRPSVSARESQAELPTPAHRLAVPARPPNTPRQHSGDNLRSGLAGPVTDKALSE